MKVAQIWKRYAKSIPADLIEREFCYSENIEQKDLLFLGLNPSFEEESLNQAVKYNVRSQLDKNLKNKEYFKRILSSLEHRLFDIDLRDDFAYADLFYYRTNEKDKVVEQLIDDVNGLMFLEDQLTVTQKLIEEVIKPKVIVLRHWHAAVFMGMLGSKGDFTWLGYDLELVEYTGSEHPVYQIKGIIDDIALPIQFGRNTNLLGTYVILYPYVETAKLIQDQKILNAWELKRYQELAYNDRKKDISPYPEKGNTVDIDILLKFPTLYSEYFLGDQKGYISNKNKKIIEVLKSFRKFNSKEMGRVLFAYLSKERLLSEEDIDNLTMDPEYCKKVFGVNWFVLNEVTGVAVKDAAREKKMYFTTPFFFLDKRVFFLIKECNQENRDKLEKWFVELMIKKERYDI
ncbi:hypothetical protein [Myroides sp. LoEW2-1]|nr:hypothetical protein [Myroides sp. LoEW2-1]MVX36844.1 hypothetical protein [Myroides sp. LoEW2-1]